MVPQMDRQTMLPLDADGLIAAQLDLAAGPRPPLWTPPDRPILVAGSWVCFPRGVSGPGSAGDPMWAGAVVMKGRRVVERAVRAGVADAPYVPGLMAMRVGRLMEHVVGALTSGPDVLLVDATSRDHPRRAGLALHLGALLDLPTVGVTHRTLVATGDWPDDARGASTPLVIGNEIVGAWVRTRPGTRPLAVHPGWRVDLDGAVGLVLATTAMHRTPEPLRRARQVARVARAEGGG
jgi:deoxyribonuclease V